MKSLPVQLQQPHVQRTDTGSSSTTARHTAVAQNLTVAHHLRTEKIRAIKLLIAFAVATKVGPQCIMIPLSLTGFDSTI